MIRPATQMRIKCAGCSTFWAMSLAVRKIPEPIIPPTRTSTESRSERLRTSDVDCDSWAMRLLDIILFLLSESTGEFVSLGPTLKKLIDPEISRASSLPAQLYTDAAVPQTEKEKIFLRTWQVIGHVSQLQQPGDYITANLVGEPLLIVRNAKGELKGFYNVCRHRA